MLKMSSATLAALSLQNVSRALAQGETPDDIDFWNAETVSFNELYNYPPMLGRVEANRIRIFEGPRVDSPSIRNIYLFYIMPIYRAVRGDVYAPSFQNDVWFDIGEGYVHSSHVVPCREIYNAVETDVGDGFWGELTVPMVWLHVGPSLSSKRYDYRAGFGTTFWVQEVQTDDEGRQWYKLLDDFEESQPWWVIAQYVRRVSPAEFAPINPHVEDKRMQIDILNQTLTCFENNLPVYQTRLASGTEFADDEGNSFDFSTPAGTYNVQRKRPSRHMVGGEAIDDYYNLPGVPWDTYFTFTGAAIHGTYWHNDYGRGRSHGCINVTSDAAKWVYRWSQPYLTYEEDYRWTEPGEVSTPIEIF